MRTFLRHGARTVLCHAQGKTDQLSCWTLAVQARRGARWRNAQTPRRIPDRSTPRGYARWGPGDQTVTSMRWRLGGMHPIFPPRNAHRAPGLELGRRYRIGSGSHWGGKSPYVIGSFRRRHGLRWREQRQAVGDNRLEIGLITRRQPLLTPGSRRRSWHPRANDTSVRWH